MARNWENIKKTARGKLDMVDRTNSLNDTFRDLGIEVHSQITEEAKGDVRYNPKVKSLIDKADRLKQSIKDEEMEIEGIKKKSVPKTKTDEDAESPAEYSWDLLCDSFGFVAACLVQRPTRGVD